MALGMALGSASLDELYMDPPTLGAGTTKSYVRSAINFLSLLKLYLTLRAIWCSQLPIQKQQS